MATPTYSQPLMNNSSKHTPKILIFSLSIIACLSLVYVGSNIIQSYPSNPINIISNLCGQSHNPTSLLALISQFIHNHGDHHTLSLESNGQDLLQYTILLPSHISHINLAIEEITKEINQNDINNYQRKAFVDCLELMDLSRDRVASSIKALANNNNNNNKFKSNPSVINAWLSAVLTNHVTCMDQLHDHYNININNNLRCTLDELILRARALLEIQVKVFKPSNGLENLLETSRSRRLYPSWVSKSDKKFLEGSRDNNNGVNSANVVVAKDGSGNFTTVGEAVATAPDKGKERYVIYVKEGVYEENVEVSKKKSNVMIVGDGMNLTIITGSLNFVDGTTTFRSATLAAVGDGFILQDICIENTAGAEKHQAVALRIGSDRSIINRCKIQAYQDTLYAHSLRQFYRDCSISGTVDFIFGNAAAVLQNCLLIARKPMLSQKNIVTAQGRTDVNQNTGTSIQYCNIIASPELAQVQPQFPTYLGRPWKNFSRTVVMQSYIGDHVDPKGWSIWDGDFGLNTLYYGEYMNRGPGSDTSNRVNWTGYHVITDPEEAKQFTVGQFIEGQEWLDPQLVTFEEGL